MPVVSVPLIPVPQHLAVRTNKANTYRSLVAAALGERCAPAPVDLEDLPRERLFLPPGLLTKIEALQRDEATPFPQLFAGLCQAGLQLMAKHHAAMASRIADAAPPPFAGASQEQTTFYQHICASLDAGRICVAEASTGVGKSRAMIMAALRQAEQGNGPIVIAAPTIKVLGQLWGEMEALQAEGLGRGVQAAFFPGITEFVDTERLQHYLSTAPAPDAAVAAWAAAGGPVLHDTPLIRALRRTGLPLAFLMEDLRQLATELAPVDFAPRDEEGHEAIAAVRARAQHAQVLFCTHMMLGRAHQGRWVAFPKPRQLIIDEAHQLEQNFALIHSQQLSLHALRRRLSEARGQVKSSELSKAIAAVDQLMAGLRHLDAPTALTMVRLSTAHAGTVLDAFQTCATLLKSRRLSQVEGIGEARDVLSDCIEVLSGQPGRAYLTFSPDWRFPSLQVGRASIAGFLGDLWRSAEGGAVIASATLYLPDEFGNHKCDYVMDLLALPSSRVDTPLPVVAPWVTGNPVLHIPTPERAALLARPVAQARTATAEDQWLEHLAQAIREIVDQAAGGTLILATSFAQVNGLAARLDMPDRLVVHRPNQKFARAEQRFRELHAAGHRPILIGVGTAWTGVDLTDKTVPPQADMLLTDLIVACSPIGLNQTSTMLARIERIGVASIVLEALMLLRQGLGRIIRHADMQNRHIWMLDGRLWSDWPAMERFTRAARVLLERYPTRETF